MQSIGTRRIDLAETPSRLPQSFQPRVVGVTTPGAPDTNAIEHAKGAPGLAFETGILLAKGQLKGFFGVLYQSVTLQAAEKCRSSSYFKPSIQSKTLRPVSCSNVSQVNLGLFTR